MVERSLNNRGYMKTTTKARKIKCNELEIIIKNRAKQTVDNHSCVGGGGGGGGGEDAAAVVAEYEKHNDIEHE